MKKLYQFVLNHPALEDDDNGKLTNEVPVSTMIGEVHTLSAGSADGGIVDFANTSNQEIMVTEEIQGGSSTKIAGKSYKDLLTDDSPVGVTDPIEMLKYVESKVVKGQELNVSDLQVSLEGDVNYITIDRDNILTTTFDELKEVHDFRLMFQVQFYGEEAADSGGPRREWICLCNQKIKEKYFDAGLKDFLSDDYYLVWQMAAIAFTQGEIPRYFPEIVLQEVFLAENPSSECIAQLRNGLDVIGIRQFGNSPILEDGSNKAMQEKSVYSKFVKYVREAPSGRRIVSLGDILEFVTGSSAEPALGFELKPCIQFTGAIITDANKEQTDAHAEKRKYVADFLPQVHTCSYTLTLPTPNMFIQLAEEESLFNLYDFAFKNTYFGRM
eukprot:gene6638-7386_t